MPAPSKILRLGYVGHYVVSLPTIIARALFGMFAL
jgi:hypothetical protein